MSLFSDMRSACLSIDAGNRLNRQAELPLRAVTRSPPLGLDQIYLDMPLLQRVALLGMIHTTLTSGIIRRMTRIEECQDRPSLPDYRDLTQLRFCEKKRRRALSHAHRGGPGYEGDYYMNWARERIEEEIMVREVMRTPNSDHQS